MLVGCCCCCGFGSSCCCCCCLLLLLDVVHHFRFVPRPAFLRFHRFLRFLLFHLFLLWRFSLGGNQAHHAIRFLFVNAVWSNRGSLDSHNGWLFRSSSSGGWLCSCRSFFVDAVWSNRGSLDSHNGWLFRSSSSGGWLCSCRSFSLVDAVWSRSGAAFDDQQRSWLFS